MPVWSKIKLLILNQESEIRNPKSEIKQCNHNLKQMKFNWGHGIFIFLTIFLLTMAFVVYKSFQEKNALVESEYYPKGLVYEKQIKRIANADAMPEKISLSELNGSVVIKFPSIFKEARISGSLYFYRPSDDTGDHTEPIKCDSTLLQKVPAGKLMSGKYIVKMNWTMNGKEYYHEEALFMH